MSNRLFAPTKSPLFRASLRMIPISLTILRAVLSPVVFVLLMKQRFGTTAIVYLIALLSDIYDGVIARRLGIVTRSLRLADSYADIIFFAGLGFGILLGFPRSLAVLAVPFWTFIGLTLINWGLCLWRFGRMTSYHSKMMKLFALGLFAGILSLLLGMMTWPIAAAFWFVVIATLEEIAMTMVLPRYHHDVWTIFTALELRAKDQRSD